MTARRMFFITVGTVATLAAGLMAAAFVVAVVGESVTIIAEALGL